MDLVGLLLIGVVLAFGMLYAAWSSWIAWGEIANLSRSQKTGLSRKENGRAGDGFGVGSSKHPHYAGSWSKLLSSPAQFQHAATLLVSAVFLGVAASLCVSIAQKESCWKAVEALKILVLPKTTCDETTWGEKGHRGTFHTSMRPGGKCITGASLCYMTFDNSDLEQVVEKFPRIQWFLLSGTQIDDRAMPLLAKKRDLTALVLTDTRVGDRGLAAFQGHKALEELDLTRTAITDRSLAAIDSLPALRHLVLCETDVTDAGLKFLEGNTTLRILNIDGTRISDSAAASLVTLTGLDTLYIRDCNLSGAALGRLRRAFPRCQTIPEPWEVSLAQTTDPPAADEDRP